MKKMLACAAILSLLSSLPAQEKKAEAPLPPLNTYKVHLVGYSHIDLSWLWRKEETIKLVIPHTFTSVLSLMEEFPGFHFTMSQGQIYQWTRNFHPDLYHRIQEMTAKGNWEPISGWVENDCNLPGGESFIRQFLYGVREIKKDFGKRTWIAICPDSFGYNGNMPQLLRHSGFYHFYTSKLNWNDTNPFPCRLFWWKGIDGTKVLTLQSVGGYGEKIREKRVLDLIKQHRDHHPWIKDVMVVYGVGDHGGGPTRTDLQNAVALMKKPGYPKLEFSSVENYFRSVVGEGKEAIDKLPQLEGELYLEYHRGTYTSQEMIKRFNMESEEALLSAEKLCSVGMLFGGPWPVTDFRKSWKRHLLNQMHDILPGSSIKPVYDDVQADYLLNFQAAARARKAAMTVVGRRIPKVPGEATLVFWNPLSWGRRALVHIRLPRKLACEKGPWVLQGEGLEEPLACQPSLLERDTLVALVDVPPMGLRALGLARGEGTVPGPPLSVGEYFLDNGLVRVEIDPATGRISRVLDLRNHKDLLAPGKQAGYQFFDDKPKHYDAWNLGLTFLADLDKPESVEIVEKGPVVATIRTVHRWSNSKFVTFFRLVKGDPKVRIRCVLDWLESRKLVKFAFPLSVDPKEATYEIAFGALDRSTRRETSWEKARYEVSGLAFADMSKDGYGAGILTHGRHGFDALHNVLRVSLVKAPISPDPTADRHRHDLRLALVPHSGDWRKAEMANLSREWNWPVRTFFAPKVRCAAEALPPRVSFYSVTPRRVILEAVKRAEDRPTFILRLFESTGLPARDTVIRLPRKCVKWRFVNGLEEPRNPDPYGWGGDGNLGKWREGAGREIRLDFRPFQIRTLEVEF